MEIRTNKLVYSLDRDRLSCRFNIFKVTTSEKYIHGGALVLDVPEMDRRAKSLLFESGQSFYVLMNHNDNNRVVLKEVLAISGEQDQLSFEEITPMEMKDHNLLQLLLNALPCPDSKYLCFNNLTGHFYGYHPEWIERGKKDGVDVIWKVPCLEFRITGDMHLNLSMHTFTSELLKKKITFDKKPFEKYPKYVLSEKFTLRRRNSSDNGPSFIMRQTDVGRSNKTFLDLNSANAFRKSRIGVAENVMQIFNAEYEGIARIDFQRLITDSDIETRKLPKKKTAEIVGKHFYDRKIKIIDMTSDISGQAMCGEIRDSIEKIYGLKVSSGKRISRDCINICLIHNARYYDGSHDPHSDRHDGTVIQHITLEDFKSGKDSALATIFNELAIKDDIENLQITIFDWTALGFTDDVSFGVRETSEDGTYFRFMKIHPDGSFDVERLDLDFFHLNEYTECLKIFDEAETRKENICGIIRDASGNINIIKDTDWITIPEITGILEELEKNGKSLSRSQESRDSLLGSVTDIRMFHHDGRLCYFSGEIGYGMNRTAERAANIRTVELYGQSENLMEKLLPSMDVTFVRNGQLTVVPFPFKYLREYILKYPKG